jgi:glutamate-1-semialdehyde 2,1-aminomutase
MRQLANLDGGDKVLTLARATVENEDGIAERPTSLHLWLGNLCNLKCRMCNPDYSSQIAADPDHARWTGRTTREAYLLPDFLPGVEYSGLGELDSTRGGIVRRSFVDRQIQVQFTGNGTPIFEIEVEGTKSGGTPLELLVSVDGKEVARPEIASGEWRIACRPFPPAGGKSSLQLGLLFRGPAQEIGIRSLRVACQAPLTKRYVPELVTRLAPELQWAEDRTVVVDELFERPERIRHLDFAGGEPMLNPHLPTILKMLVDGGHAPRISLCFSTNATIYSPEIAGLLAHFEKVAVNLSLDGVNELQEYIRPPARWEQVWKNALRYFADPISVAVHPAPQAYNLFGLIELVRLCDSRRIPVSLNNVLYWPRYLSFDMLPQPIVDEARAEWEGYLASECPERSVAEVETLIASLRRPRAPNCDELRDQFARFTSDLDRSRNQSLRMAAPRLHSRLIECGIDFGLR